MVIENLKDYTLVPNILENSEWLFVIKSQDQVERRKRLLGTKRDGKLGRISKRPVGKGLLVKAKLKKQRLQILEKYHFDESRHIIKLDSGSYFLSTIDKLYRLGSNLKIEDSQSNKLYAFLHTVNKNSTEDKFLVVSSGYDSIFEINLNGDVLNHWLAWENGFNPDSDENWLALHEDKFQEYINEGKKAKLIKPEDFGREGLLTSLRSAHPNLAVYDPYINDESIIISIGHEGCLYRINFNKNQTNLLTNELNQMPHGLYPFKNGWCITNTTKGEFWQFDKKFKVKEKMIFSDLEYKIKGTEDIEWIQQVIPFNERYLLALDANRGIITADIEKKKYSIYFPDQNWCFQDAIPLTIS